MLAAGSQADSARKRLMLCHVAEIAAGVGRSRWLAERALAVKLTNNQRTNNTSEAGDERQIHTAGDESSETLKPKAFPHLSLLRDDCAAAALSTPKFPRRWRRR